jgi:hypothetical protein
MSAPAGSITVRLDGPLARADLPGLCEHLQRALEASEVAVVLCELGPTLDPDLVTIDALARLQLTATRFGRRIRFRPASAELRTVVDLTGLRELLRVEAGREPEEREQRLGVEEERALGDPSV